MSELTLLVRKIRRLFGRTLVRRVKYVNKIRYFQIQQEGGVALDNVEHIEPFGFTSHPALNAEALVLAFNGNGSHSVAILAGDKRYRIEISEGEAAIYNGNGDKVHIKNDSTISVEAATKVELVTPEVECTGKLIVAETIEAGGQIKSGADIEATTTITAGTDVLAGVNVTATALVSGAQIATASGAAAMAADGAMTVKQLDAETDVTAGGTSLSAHTHTDSNGGNTGPAQ